MENLKKLQRKDRKQQIKEEQVEIAKVMGRLKLEDEEEKLKKLRKTLEM